MNPENWQKVKDIFNEVIELPLSEREKVLGKVEVEIRLEVEKLIESDKNAETFPGAIIPALQNDFLPIEKIGNYKIIKEIGEGGMGTVFLASREDFEKTVALKILKYEFSSKELLLRFQNERKILAALEHPNIARLLDGGTTEKGLPFFAMEYVDGEELINYCDSKNFSITERLKIFRQICSAVAYAHSKLIVHRDLKPSNILVTKGGEPKLLDFGISKFLDENSFEQTGTATALGLMTPTYASPEQFRRETVSTSTDIYSLGVILYELLTGVLPYQIKNKRIDEVAQAVCETRPLNPSEVVFEQNRNDKNSKILRGDLDNIIQKSLRKEIARRYSSVEMFSDDIRRHLEGLPVTARPDTFFYRAEKFIKRNQTAVLAGLLIFLTLVGGITATTWQSIRAERQRKISEQRFNQVREIANKVVFRYHDEIAKLAGSTAVREELITDAVQYLDNLNTEEIDDNQLKLELAKAYEKIGDVQGRPFTANLGKTEDALQSYQKAGDILKNAIEKSPKEFELKRELVSVYLRLAELKMRFDIADYRQNSDNALQLQLEINQEDLSDSAKNASELAAVYLFKGDAAKEIPERIEFYQKTVKILESLSVKSPSAQHNLTRVNQRLGTNYLWLGDEFMQKGDKVNAMENYQNALPYNLKTLDSINQEISANGLTQSLQRNLAAGQQNLGDNYLKLGESEKDLEMLQKSLNILLELAKTDENNVEAQIDLADIYTSFAESYKKFGDYPKALEANEKALKIYEKINLNNLANLKISKLYVTALDSQAGIFQKMKLESKAKFYQNKIGEACKIDYNVPFCNEKGFAKKKVWRLLTNIKKNLSTRSHAAG